MVNIYPGMTYNEPLSSPIEVYVYGSAIIGILGTFGLFFTKEHRRIYRTMKRKNTDDSPILQV